MNTAIVPGSIAAIAQQTGKSIAETFLNADIVVIVDTSGSMDSNDSRGGLSRYDVACEELKKIQAQLPGKIAVIAFSSEVLFCPNGIPHFFHGGTDLAAALRFCKTADLPGMRFILISDGQPDEPQAVLRVARTFQNHIDVIYVGPEGYGSGREFLERLASVTGGTAVQAIRAVELGSGLALLLGARNG